MLSCVFPRTFFWIDSAFSWFKHLKKNKQVQLKVSYSSLPLAYTQTAESNASFKYFMH